MVGIVVLEDGTVFTGESFGAPGERVGEVVFNTAMSGYQEVLTDPSYNSQVVTMTYPLIGNYGINETDSESSRIQVAGFVVKEACRRPSNFTSVKSLGAFLAENGIVGIEGIDTRALTRRIRLQGAMKSAIYAGDARVNADDLVDKARAWEGLMEKDCVGNVTCREPFVWNDGKIDDGAAGTAGFLVVAFDFGIKYNILRILKSLGCRVRVAPAATPASAVLSMNPDGVFLSNGPGDPGGVMYAVETIRQLVGNVPLFGICLGHQLLGMAIGGRRYKLRFGHHGANHPVRNVKTGAVEITSQNHNYCIEPGSLAETGAVMTHVNLNDGTCEGLEDMDRMLFSVQYHPEASPGPHDSGYLFERFIGMMETRR